MNVLLFIGGVLVGVLIEHYIFKKPCATDDDPTGQVKQQIFTDLTKLKADIESTVN